MDKVVIACDFKTKLELEDFLARIEPQNARLFLKLGMEIIYSLGLGIIREMQNRGHRIFLDLKLCDTPNTVARAIKILLKYKPDYITIHLSGGEAMVKAASLAVAGAHTQLIGVTVLTSLDKHDIKAIYNEDDNSSKVVSRLIKLGLKCGINNFVSSALEVPVIRAIEMNTTCFCPGICKTIGFQDQKQVATPIQARNLGANYIVVGREIVTASNPCEAYTVIKKEFEHVNK